MPGSARCDGDAGGFATALATGRLPPRAIPKRRGLRPERRHRGEPTRGAARQPARAAIGQRTRAAVVAAPADCAPL
jgi:hypothetical protein